MESLNIFGEWLAANLWRLSVEMLILAGVVFFAIWLFRIKSPSIRHLFWCVVLAKPVFTFLIASPISLYSFLSPDIPPSVKPEPRIVAKEIHFSMPIRRMRMARPYRKTPIIKKATLTEPEPFWSKIDWYGGFALFWIAFASILSVRFIAGFIYVVVIFHRAKRQTDGLFPRLVNETSAVLNIKRRVRVAVSSVNHGPVLAGVLRPIILIPQDLIDHLSNRQFRYVIAHELVHVKRFDNLVLIIQRLAEIFLFFHPVVWLCGRMTRHLAETACDDAVVDAFGESVEYADSLTRVAELRGNLTRRLLVNTFAATESNFTRRVRRILKGDTKKLTLGFALFCLTVLTVIACLGLPTSQPEKAKNVEKKKADIKSKGKVEMEKQVVVENVPSKKGVNSVIACLTSILKSQGYDVSYEYLMGLGGRAFRLQFSGCPSAQHSFCGFNTAKPAARVFGYDLNTYRLRAPGHHKDPKPPSAREVKESWNALKKSIDSGIPGIADWEESNILVGYEPPKGKDNGLLVRIDKDEPYFFQIQDLPWSVTLLEKQGEVSPRKEAIINSLKIAIRNAYAPTLSGINVDEMKTLTYPAGFDAWDEWLKFLEKYDEKKEGNSGSFGNACCYNCLIDARKAAVKYLDIISKEFKEETAEQLRKSRENYQKVVEHLTAGKQYVKYPGQFKKNEMWTKEMRQKQIDAIKKALSFERKAIQNIERALKEEGVEMNSVSNSGKTVIENVPALAWGQNQDVTFIGALAAAMKVAEPPRWNYDDLMGFSGMAFRLRWHPESCPSAAVAEFPEEENGIIRCTGREITMTEQWGRKGPMPQDVKKKIVAYIDAGKPVVAYCTGLDMGVIVGYRDGGDTLLVHDYHKAATPYELSLDKLGPMQYYLGSVGTIPTPRERLVESLKLAMSHGTRQEANVVGRVYFYGDKAIQEWIDALKKADPKNKKAYQTLQHTNGFNYATLIDCRKAAIHFLEKNIEYANAKAVRQLKNSIKAYEKEVEFLERNADLFKTPSAKWTNAVRAKQIKVLDELRPLDAAPIPFLKAALKAEGETVLGNESKFVILDTVPWVGFYQGPSKGNPEDHPLPSVMRSMMEYIGDDLGLPNFAKQSTGWQWDACSLFHGVTGSGFGFSWKEPYGESYLGKDLIRSYDHAFGVAGYSYKTLLKPAFANKFNYAGPTSDDEKKFRRLIVESIRDKHRPVIAIGVIGPEEPCLICGYENDGETIIGWNYFQDEARKNPQVSFDADGRFVMKDWFPNTHGIILIGDKLSKSPDRKALYRQALLRDLTLLCEPDKNGFPLGVTAYRDWIDYLLKPIDGKVTNDPKKLAPLHKRHNEMIGELAERRAYAATFLAHAAEAIPSASSELTQASYCFKAMHDLLWRVWQTLGNWNKTDDAKLLRYGKQNFRLELAALVRRLQLWDLEAAKHLRAALLKMKVSRSELPELPKIEPIEGLRDLGIDNPLPGELGKAWITHNLQIPDVPTPKDTGLFGAVRAATAATPWPITKNPTNKDLNKWASDTGWRVKIIKKPSNEQRLPAAKRINDVILSCLYNLPVATTYDGKPAVIVGYDHLAGQKLSVRVAGQSKKEPVSKIPINDKKWGSEWVFLTGRL